MGLIIDWATKPNADLTKITVPVFGAELVIQYAADVIVKASWQLASDHLIPNESLSDREKHIRYYLLDSRYALRLKLVRQQSNYFHRVWDLLLKIPLGQVMTYSEVAQRLESGPRAVARACRENPYAGIIPCHRVVAKSGLGGFMGQKEGGWVGLKGHILSLERSFV